MPKEPLEVEEYIHSLKKDAARSGMTVEALRQAFAENLFYALGKHPARATNNDIYMAVAYSIRDRIMHRTLNMLDALLKHEFRLVCYLSAEYMLGPQLGNNLINLGIYEEAKKALDSYGIKIDKVFETEPEPGLGNGGLGRLAACFLDSLATLEYPAIGYGIRYEFGLFNQEIKEGWQKEVTDKWLSLGNPWEIARPEAYVEVKLGGHTESYQDEKGNYRVKWIPSRVVKGIPYDTALVGFGVNNCNILRLWKAEATESFDFDAFNVGDYYRSVEAKVFSENITKILYPNDEALKGKQLRLEQQYFFASCSLQDMLRILQFKGKKLENFPEMFAIQLNDTHPSIAIPELIRLLVDEYQLDWDVAWDITSRTFSYTNHTLLPEALEKWSIGLLTWALPRHLEIIYEINRRFLETIESRYPGDTERMRRMSIIDETGERYVRMAHLACISCHTINGVSALHTNLIKERLFPDFAELWPKKFLNITNGITPRRFLVLSNPKLAKLIISKMGTDWIKNLEELRKLEPLANNPSFQKEWQKIKLENKQLLAGLIHERTGIIVSPETLFDVMVKRFHEYKRQHLKVLHILTLYNRIKKNPSLKIVPRTFIFGGKAAPGYRAAKLIIKLISSIAEVINQDGSIGDQIKVVLFPNYNVKNGQRIFPAADLSEQISTAGKEASGTGNMKLAMNGALTVGTLDGANIEIRSEVGAENFFTFGLTEKEVLDLRKTGYKPIDYYNQNGSLREVIDQISSGYFSNGDTHLFSPFVESLLNFDPFFLLADYQSYIDCQDRIDEAYRDQAEWTRMSILNVARMGKFSSDRAIQQYCTEIWHTTPFEITDTELLK